MKELQQAGSNFDLLDQPLAFQTEQAWLDGNPPPSVASNASKYFFDKLSSSQSM
jgi:hypothetical protein